MSKRTWSKVRFIIILIASVILATIIQFINRMSPAWGAMATASTPQVASFVGVMLQIVTIGFWIIVVGVGLWFAVKIYSSYSDAKLRWAQPNEAGFFPLQTIDSSGGGMAGLFGGLMGNNFKMIVDINKLPTGIVHQMIEAPRIDSNQQLAYATTHEKSKALATIIHGNARAATTRAALTSLDRHNLPKPSWTVVDEPVIPQPLPEVRLLNAQEAFNQSTDTSWIIGQNRETGNLCEFNIRELLYFGVLGEKRTGKTSRVGKLLFAYGLRFGFRVAVCDGKGGADWEGVCKNRAEFHKLDHNNIGDIIWTLTEERKRRQEVLNRYGVNNIWLLPKEARLQPVYVIMDEFGSVMDTLKVMDKSSYEKVDVAFGDFFRLGGSTGICMTIIDQFPGKWGKATRANMSTNVMFKIGGGLGASVGEYNLHKLKKDGGFFFEQEMYHGFETWNHIDQLLPQPNRNIKPMLLNDNKTTNTGSGGVKTTGEYTTRVEYPQKSEPVEPVSVVSGGSVENRNHNTDSKRNSVVSDTVTQAPLLNGPATNRGEKLLVQSVREREGSKNKAIKVLWGSKNGKTSQWFDDAMAAVK